MSKPVPTTLVDLVSRLGQRVSRLERRGQSNIKVLTGEAITTIVIPNPGNQNLPITFPAGYFSEPPFVIGISGNGRLNVALSAATTETTAQLQPNNWSNAPAAAGIPIHWIAIGR